MAKLVDLLAKYLVEWPDGAKELVQCSNGSVYTDNDYFVMNIDVASDWASVSLTEKEYLAARDSLHAEIVQYIKVGGTLEVQEFDADQSLWDKVAVAAMQGLISSDSFHSHLYQQRPDAAADFGCSCADAFMAERAKRLKGGA